MHAFAIKSVALTAALAIAPYVAIAQSQSLPHPSRTVYKCQFDGKVVYSDSPCLGAERLDIEPTRGLSTYTGKERTGQDVQREKLNEAFGEALRPLTGLTPKQHETHARRFRLVPEARDECGRLDIALPDAEAAEKTAIKESLSAFQRQVFLLRHRFRELGC
jgi:hypothetical protein